MSSETLHQIVQSLNRDPFNLGTTIIAFDSFPASRLLQILSDVICWIIQSDPVDIGRESAEETVMRILHHLRLLKYRPPSDIEELEEWRAGIVEGSKRSVYPVLAYLFANSDNLKERAYLAKYLVKVEIPSEVHDMDTAQLQNELAQMMEKFKEVHSRVVEVRHDSIMLDDIRSDLKSMEGEKEALGRKIEKAERRVQNLPQLEKFMKSAEELRAQKDRLAELNMQRSEQREGVIHADQKLQRLKTQLAEAQQAGENIDPTDLIAQLQDESQTNRYMVETKLANDIKARRTVVHDLSKISDLPAIDQRDIREMNDQIAEITTRIIHLEEERDKSEEGLEDNFSIFRHQAAAVERKKEMVAQRLQTARQELSRLESQVDEKKQELKSRSGVDIISAKEFRSFVSYVRSRTAEYKKKKSEIEELITEKGTLVRTMEMLSNKFTDLREKIESMGGEIEENVEISVPQRPRTAAPRSDDVEELRHLVKGLMEKLDRRKDEIEPMRREKDGRMERFNELSEFVRSKKADYDRRKEQLEMGFAALKEEVDSLEHRYNSATEDLTSLEEKIEESEKTMREMQLDGDGLKRRVEEQLQSAEREAEEFSRGGSNSVMDIESAKQQVIMWRSLHILFEAKLHSLQKDRPTDGDRPIGDRGHY